MTDKEINRATISTFIARCINLGAASAIDAEFGLRLVGAEVNKGQVWIEFEGGSHAIYLSEDDALEAAIERMGWPEIHAFQNELSKGQDYREDAGGFIMRAIRRLFGKVPTYDVVNYQEAARAMVEKAKESA